FLELRTIPGFHLLAENIEHRLGMISFYIDSVHYNLIVKLLNDRFGIQVRGGCSCAGTYGHYLLNLDQYTSKRITDKIDVGDNSERPGWVRMSIHPTTTDEESDYMIEAIREIQRNAQQWGADYSYDTRNNEFIFKGTNGQLQQRVEQWFSRG
ncbi:MAG: aminotransferase class V-fold PLP-dependent enzyme, partial [Bacteroidota bacterium]